MFQIKIRGIGISARDEEDYDLVKSMINEIDASIKCISFSDIIHSPEYLDSIDFLFTIGGDGSVAWLVSAFYKAFDRVDTLKPIVPIVRPESIGYLKQIDLSPKEKFFEGFNLLLKNEFEINHRTILTTPFSNQSLSVVSVNEIYLSCTPHLGKFTVSVEQTSRNGNKKLEIVATILADGLMVVTPIGSTAWALSHGGLVNVNEDAIELIFIGATHRASNFIIPNKGKIHINLELKNPVITKDSVFAYNEARKNQNLPIDPHAKDTLTLVYSPQLIVDGKLLGFGRTNVIIDPKSTIPFVSISQQSIFAKARKLTENTSSMF